MKLYTSILFSSLFPKLHSSDARIASSSLSTIGDLSSISKGEVSKHLDKLFSFILETLQDQGSAPKRESALHALGLLAENTGQVITPYLQYPRLMPILIHMIQSEKAESIRKELLSVVGILGALDPYRYKLLQLKLEGRTEDEEGTGKTEKSSDMSDSMDSFGPSSEEYYTTITVNALMRILLDNSLKLHHVSAIHAIMLVVKTEGTRIIPFLSQIIPPFLKVLQNCEPEIRPTMFQQLALLIRWLKQHLREYLANIFPLVKQLWVPTTQTHIIGLLEELSLAFSVVELRDYITEILPEILQVIYSDTSPNRMATSRLLHAMKNMSDHLEPFFHLIIPAVTSIASEADISVKLSIEIASTLAIICKRYYVIYDSSLLIQAFLKFLDNSNQNLQKEAAKGLCYLGRHLGKTFLAFVPTINRLMEKHHFANPEYENFILKLKEGLPIEIIEENDVQASTDHEQMEEFMDPLSPRKKEKINGQHIKKTLEISQQITREDWADWLRRFSLEIVQESPSPALRSCISVATEYQPIMKELFNASFFSCWMELGDVLQRDVARNLELVLLAPTLPADILQFLLNLIEFMELAETPLPIDSRILGSLAEKCHAYAKALRYKEMEFRKSPTTAIEALITINNQLQQNDAALGILTVAQTNYSIDAKETWYEQLQRWRQALQGYERRQLLGSNSLDVVAGKVRCLAALGEWDRVESLAREAQDGSHTAKQLASLASTAAWNLGHWGAMKQYVQDMDKNTVDYGFFRTVLAIRFEEFEKAKKYIAVTRKLMDSQIMTLISESYDRAYKIFVTLQELSELEEVISYKNYPERRSSILHLWRQRLEGCERSVDTWQRFLAVHSLVLSPSEDMKLWMKFCSLCRKTGRADLAEKTFSRLLGLKQTDFGSVPLPIQAPAITFAFIKHIWAIGQHIEAFDQIKLLLPVTMDTHLKSKLYRKIGEWQLEIQDLDEENEAEIIESLKTAVDLNEKSSKAWHFWALANYEAAGYHEKHGTPIDLTLGFVVPSLKGFFKSIAMSSRPNLQDTLRLLTLWFKFGAHKEVAQTLVEGFPTVSIDTWLHVVPQVR